VKGPVWLLRWLGAAVVCGLVAFGAAKAGGVIAAAVVVCAVAAAWTFVPVLKIHAPVAVALIGGYLGLSVWTALGGFAIWLVLALYARKPLSGSYLAIMAMPFGYWLLDHPGPVLMVLSIVASAIAVMNERSQIQEHGL
jgi:hypothetical protein